MNKIARVMGLWLGTLLLATALRAQGTQADYARATNLAKATENKIFRDRVRPHWLPGNTRFWYRIEVGPEAHEFVLVDAEAGTRTPAFDHERLATALSKSLGKELKATRLPLDKLEFAEAGPAARFTVERKRFRYEPGQNELQEETADTNATASLPVQDAPHASRRTGDETAITFINRTKVEVELFWIDADGQRQRYTTVAAGAEHRQHTFAGHVWLAADRSGQTLAVFEATEDPGEAVIDAARAVAPPTRRRSQAGKPAKPRGESPDGKWVVFLKDHNVQARNLENGEEFALSSDGSEAEGYTDRIHWSPDSTRVVVIRERKGDDRKVHLIESSPKDQLQPKLHTLSYAKPGDRIAVAKPQLFDVPGERQIPVSDQLFTNAWSLSDLRWWPDSSRFMFLYNQRGHQALRIVSVDARTGEAKAIVDEQSPTFIDYAGKEFTQHLDATRELIWMSERDGWNHLYLVDAETGQVKHPITHGDWVVREVEKVDEAQRQVWFRAGGVRPDQDPYYVHLCRVNFDGTGLQVLTEGDGTHDVEFSPDRRFLIDRWSRVDQPAVTELRRADDGRMVCVLERADASALVSTGWRAPERFVAQGRDGKTDIYGILIRPSQLDPGRKYPVIEEIYAGPQAAFVPKAFGLQLRQHAIAELGFVVVQIDGMGTSFRSKAFHDVCWRNLGDSGFPDRIAWMRAAAAQYPYLDLTRVGIYGGSAGGQSSTRAVLAHGDFYKVAVSDCGCHDNRMDKIWWNELWMGWPIGPHYAEQSNVTQAHRLEGKLMLTVGELDRNVDPASTMQLANALIKANKDFELLLVPGAGHGVGETPYASRRRMDFFVRHLLGVEPRCPP